MDSIVSFLLLYVSNDENFEAVFIKEIENKYALVFKAYGMSYFDVVDVESDSIIEGNLDEDTYKITQDGKEGQKSAYRMGDFVLIYPDGYDIQKVKDILNKKV